MQSGSIYAQQLDLDLFAVNVDHVILLPCVILQDTLSPGREKTLVILRARSLRSCFHPHAPYQHANEFNTFHQSQRRGADEVSADMTG